MKKYITFTLITLAFHLYGQRRITGIVTNGNIQLDGVSITIKDTEKKTLTDVDGSYNIYVDGDAKTLIFSHVGTIKQEVIIGKTDTINVKLEDDSLFLKTEVEVIDDRGTRRGIYYRPTRNVPTYYSMFGLVKDAKGNPLVGVLVTHKISKKIAISDSKGVYSIKIFEEHGSMPINLDKNNSVLVFLYEGLKTKEIFIGKENVDAEVDEGSILENSDSKEQIGDLEVGLRQVYNINVYLATVILEKRL
jgi:CarboxypepD_reg-like domain